MSDQIAKMSNDLVANLSLLSNLPLDEDTTNSETTTVILNPPSHLDSLDAESVVDQPALVDCTNDRVLGRKTWDRSPELDTLMLSNVVALSVRLCAIADGLSSKIALYHNRSAPYDAGLSQVPLLQQTSSQEMATLVNNLRHVESQLQRADRILGPSYKLRDNLDNWKWQKDLVEIFSAEILIT